MKGKPPDERRAQPGREGFMPQFLLVAAAGAAVYTAYRVLRREMGRVSERLAEVRVHADFDRPTRLVRGADGVFRPER
jgi:uncharacterized OsmC-like protein